MVNFKIKGTRGNMYAQLFANPANFTYAVPMSLKSSVDDILDKYIHRIGIPSEILMDGALELHRSKWIKTCVKHSIMKSLAKPNTPKQNLSELQGCILKKRIHNRMRETNASIRLCDYFFEYKSAICSLTASTHIMNDGATVYEKIMGYTPNISEYVQHKWYD